MALRKTRDPRIIGRGPAITGIVLGVAGLLFFMSIEWPALKRAKETANRVQCANNIMQIDMALALYANQNQGCYPPDFGTLYKETDLNPECFACPSSSTSVPSGMSRDQAAEWINKNADYIYNGAGLKSDIDSTYLMVYEKDADHYGDGGNAGFADGHVEFLNLQEMHKLMESSKALRQQQKAK
jgi:prepilin-type processing-associated H-X9-DG protein